MYRLLPPHILQCFRPSQISVSVTMSLQSCWSEGHGLVFYDDQFARLSCRYRQFQQSTSMQTMEVSARLRYNSQKYCDCGRSLRQTSRQCFCRASPQWWVITLRAKLSGAVYCNRSCLCVRLFVCLWFVYLFVCGSVSTITRICVHRSSPNWVCR